MAPIIDALWENRKRGPLSALELGVNKAHMQQAARLGIAKSSVDEKTRYDASPTRLYEWDRFFLRRNPSLVKCLFTKCQAQYVQTGLFDATNNSSKCCENNGYLEYTLRQC